MKNSQHLFIFTIGPVQSFIAQARKTQDLYAGSRLLSDLIIKTIENNGFLHRVSSNAPEIIFPVIDETTKSVPNRFVAIVESDNIQKLGNDLKKKVEDYFVDDIGAKITKICPDAEGQLRDFLKIHWAAILFNENAALYQSQIRQLEQILGAVKNIRTFEQFEEKGRKCSLNSDYNVKFYRLNKEESGIPRKLFNAAVKVVEPYAHNEIKQEELQLGEGLCAISFLKRKYDKEKFPSTANISLSETIRLIAAEKEGKRLLDEYAYCFQKNSYKDILNGQVFFKDNLNEKYFEKQGYSKSFLVCAEGKLHYILDNYKHLNFSKYYAILVFDADSMGKKLSAAKSKDEHKLISRSLSSYAKKASDFIDYNNLGQTVYAGGDDFMGFVNLNHLFDAMQKLRDLFDTEVNSYLPEHLKLTFSAGVAVAHYKTPLSDVLTWARQMEKEAKIIDGLNKLEGQNKNAFGLAVLKHSGEIHKAMFKWSYEDIVTTHILGELTALLREKSISDKFITNLSVEFENLMNEKGELDEPYLNHIFEKELLRLADNSSKKTDKKEIQKLMQSIYALYTKADLPLQNLLYMLQICEFISRHLNKNQNNENPIVSQNLAEATR